MTRFALLGAAGYVAPRHMRAIRALGGKLVVACDPHDSVGVLDQYAPQADFTTTLDTFWHECITQGVEYVVLCTPNDCHAAQAINAMHGGADVISEKPLALHAADLDRLAAVERATGRRVWTTFQLRLHPSVLLLREWLASGPLVLRAAVTVEYNTFRGAWYEASWKGDDRQSGGLLTNIGIHLFDLMLWLFGAPIRTPKVSHDDGYEAAGALHLDRADVQWSLATCKEGPPVRRVLVEVPDYGQQVLDLSHGFHDLHTIVYGRILAGQGIGIEDARPAVALTEALRP